jgi:threonyl-tRNA synthetase
MRLLLIHADTIAYEVLSKTKIAETEFIQKDAMQDALVVFCTVETIDEEDSAGIAIQSAEEITAVAAKIGADRVMIYPYSHLSSSLARPQTAIAILKNVTDILTATGTLEIKRAPFGCYKKFTITCKGHPLSELSRELGPKKTGRNKQLH